MYSCADTRFAGWVAPFGYPRINACSRLPVAFRSVPRPSSPPGAKASTECPSYTRYPGHTPEGGCLTMHRNHPQRTLRTLLEIFVFSAHNTGVLDPIARHGLRHDGSSD